MSELLKLMITIFLWAFVVFYPGSSLCKSSGEVICGSKWSCQSTVDLADVKNV
jgi:hypothetical protein